MGRNGAKWEKCGLHVRTYILPQTLGSIIDNIRKVSTPLRNIILVPPRTIFAGALGFCTRPDSFGICNLSKGGTQVMHFVMHTIHSWLGRPLLLRKDKSGCHRHLNNLHQLEHFIRMLYDKERQMGEDP